MHFLLSSLGHPPLAKQLLGNEFNNKHLWISCSVPSRAQWCTKSAFSGEDMMREQRKEGTTQWPEGSQVGLRNPAYGISQEVRVSLWDRESIDLKASCFMHQDYLPSPCSSLWFLWAPTAAALVCSLCGPLSLLLTSVQGCYYTFMAAVSPSSEPAGAISTWC